MYPVASLLNISQLSYYWGNRHGTEYFREDPAKQHGRQENELELTTTNWLQVAASCNVEIQKPYLITTKILAMSPRTVRLCMSRWGHILWRVFEFSSPALSSRESDSCRSRSSCIGLSSGHVFMLSCMSLEDPGRLEQLQKLMYKSAGSCSWNIQLTFHEPRRSRCIVSLCSLMRLHPCSQSPLNI